MKLGEKYRQKGTGEKKRRKGVVIVQKKLRKSGQLVLRLGEEY